MGRALQRGIIDFEGYPNLHLVGAIIVCLTVVSGIMLSCVQTNKKKRPLPWTGRSYDGDASGGGADGSAGGGGG